MKKIVIPYSLRKPLAGEGTILQRSDIVIFTAMSPDKVLSLHRTERLDLIILDLLAAKVNPESFVADIRRDPDLRKVSIILVGKDTEANRVLSSRGGANAFFPVEFEPAELLKKVGQLLTIPERQSYRSLLRVAVKASCRQVDFMAVSRNISLHGILMETAHVLQVGNELVLSFTIPQRYEIITEGMVVREAPASDNCLVYGVEFTNLHPQDQLAVGRFIGNQPPDTAED